MSVSDPLKILFLGDTNAGKTSIISTLLTEEFVENPQPVSEIVSIPIDRDGAKVCIDLIDTLQDSPDDNEFIIEQMLESPVICLVYDRNDTNAVERVINYWLPHIKSIGEVNLEHELKFPCPIVLVENKCMPIDTTEELHPTPWYDLDTLRKDFPNVEVIKQCSSLQNSAFNQFYEVFMSCVEVGHKPSFYIIDPNTGEFTEKTQETISNIFEIIDTDCDKFLLFDDIQFFQNFVWSESLDTPSLRKMIEKFQSTDHLATNGTMLTKIGFQYLMKAYAKSDLIWDVLKRFGYSNQMQIVLDNDLDEKLMCSTAFQDHCLSMKALEFVGEFLIKQFSEKGKHIAPFASLLSSKFVNQDKPMTKSQLQLSVIFFYFSSPSECLKHLILCGFTYHYGSILNAVDFADSSQNISKLYQIVLNIKPNCKSKLIQVLQSQNTPINYLSGENCFLINFKWDKNFTHTIIIKINDLGFMMHNNANAYLFELEDPDDEQRIKDCSTQYLQDLLETKMQCGFILAHDQSSFSGLVELCGLKEIPIMQISDSTSSETVLSFLSNKCLHDRNLIPSSCMLSRLLSFNTESGSLESLKANIKEKLKNYDSFLFPALLVTSAAVLLILKKQKK